MSSSVEQKRLPLSPITERVFNLETGTNIRTLVGLAIYDELSFRRLWMLVQYQHFNGEVTFIDAVASLKRTFKRNNEVTGTYWSPPRREQVLGRMREIKKKNFLGFWEQVEREIDFDIFKFALEAPVESLIFGDERCFFVPFANSRVVVAASAWKEMENVIPEKSAFDVYIPLPEFLDNKLRPNKEDGSSVEELPF